MLSTFDACGIMIIASQGKNERDNVIHESTICGFL